LPDEFALHKIQSIVVGGNDQNVLVAPAFALDRVRIDTFRSST
jgi:hypothetical protein